jgi:hypothetical protein
MSEISVGLNSSEDMAGKADAQNRYSFIISTSGNVQVFLNSAGSGP